ncbi:MAG: hypothetical protein QN174_10615, partial [Armatimonadota bacterium]|nr:hypothetical protein [Armatimonadota bacterium]
AAAVAARFGLASLAGLKAAVRGAAIDEVAAVAPLAADAARAGDATARRILDRAAMGLAAMIAAVARALAPAPEALVATGGVFAAGDLIVGPMTAELERLGVRVVLRPARFPPAVGAALLAARAAGLAVPMRGGPPRAGEETAR